MVRCCVPFVFVSFSGEDWAALGLILEARASASAAAALPRAARAALALALGPSEGQKAAAQRALRHGERREEPGFSSALSHKRFLGGRARVPRLK